MGDPWKIVVALGVAFGIGAFCARFGIPLPAPVSWIGVALIAAIWAGYALFSRG